MLQTLVQGGQSSVDSSLQQSAVTPSTRKFGIRKPAIMLAFLVALTTMVAAIIAKNSNTQHLEVPATATQQSAESENIHVADPKASISAEAGTPENTSSGNTNSVKVESTTKNGVTNTKLEVNGREIPVEPNTTTTIHDGSQTITNSNVTTQNNQTGDNGFNFNSSISSSYSSSFSNGVGGD